jgi:hypothetical protein
MGAPPEGNAGARSVVGLEPGTPWPGPVGLKAETGRETTLVRELGRRTSALLILDAWSSSARWSAMRSALSIDSWHSGTRPLST